MLFFLKIVLNESGVGLLTKFFFLSVVMRVILLYYSQFLAKHSIFCTQSAQEYGLRGIWFVGSHIPAFES